MPESLYARYLREKQSAAATPTRPSDQFGDVSAGSSTTAQRRPLLLPQARTVQPQADPRAPAIDTDRFLKELSDPSATFAESQRRSFETELEKRPQPTIQADRRLPGQRIIAQAPNKTASDVETTPRLGDQGIWEMGQDALAARGMFASNKPAGVALDFSVLGTAARLGAQAKIQQAKGNTGMAAAMVPLTALTAIGGGPISGKLARTAAGAAERRLLPNVPFPAYSRLEDAIERAPFERGTAEQWKAAIQQNVAGGERQWTGIDAYLDANKGQVIEKAQIRQVSQSAPRPKVVATTLGKAPTPVAAAPATLPAGMARPAAQLVEEGWIVRQADDGMWIAADGQGMPMASGNTQAMAWEQAVEASNRGRLQRGEAPLIEAPDAATQRTFDDTEPTWADADDAGYHIEERVNPDGETVFIARNPAGQAVNYGQTLDEARTWAVAHARQEGVTARPTAPVAPAPEPLPQGWGVEWDETHAQWQVTENGNAVLTVGTEAEARRQAASMARAVRGDVAGPPRFDREAYNEPGGTDYHERLLRLERDPITELPEGYGVKRVAEASRERRQQIVAEQRAIDEQIEREMDARPELRDANTDLPPNIRELYIRLNELENQRIVPDGNTHAVVDPRGDIVQGGTAMNAADARDRAIRQLEPKPFVQPGHFPQPNIMVHYRADMRKVGDENVMFLQEIQSDWMQKLRARQTAEKKVKEIPKRLAEIDAEAPNIGALDPRYKKIREEYNELQKELESARYDIGRTRDIPGNVPFQKTDEWIELALKDAINEAHRRGADRISWTTGLQQQKRWSVGNATDHIEFNPETGVFRAFKNGGKIHEGNYDPRALDEVVGKGPRKRLLEAPKNEQGFQALKGEELRILETWPLITYDQGIPQGAQALAKKLGIKLDIEDVNLFGGAPSGPRFSGNTTSRPVALNRLQQMRREYEIEARPGATTAVEDLIDTMEIDDVEAYRILEEIERRPDTPPQQIIDDGLDRIAGEVDEQAARAVADALGGTWNPGLAGKPNQSFRMKPFSEHLKGGGALPLWGAAAAAAGLGAAGTAEAQGTDPRFSDVRSGSSTQSQPPQLPTVTINAPAPTESLYAQFQREKRERSTPAPQQAEPQGSLYEQFQREKQSGQPFQVAGTPGASQTRAAAERQNLEQNIERLRSLKPANPAQQQRIDALIQQVESELGGAWTRGGSDRSATENAIRGVQAGLLKSTLAGAELLPLLTAPLPGANPLQPLRRMAAEARAAIDEEIDPEGKAGLVGGIVGEIAGGIPGYGGAARATGNILSLIAPSSRMGRAINAGQAGSRAQRAVTNVVTGAPVNVGMAAGMEGATTQEKIKQAAIGTAADIGFGAVMPGRKVAAGSDTPPPDAPGAPPAPPEVPLMVLQAQAAAAKTAYDDAAWKVRAGDESAEPALEAARAELNRLDAIVSARQRAQAEGTTQEPQGTAPEPIAEPSAPEAPKKTFLKLRQFEGEDGNPTPIEDLSPSELKAVRKEIETEVETATYELSQPDKQFNARNHNGWRTVLRDAQADLAAIDARIAADDAEWAGFKKKPEPTPAPKAEPAPTGPKVVKEATVDAEGRFLDARAPSGGLRDFRKVSTEGLIRESRALEERMRNDAAATAYRPVETQSSGTQADIIQMAGTRTPRGTTYQAEALQRLKNAEKVKARLEAELESRGIDRDEMNRRVAEQEEFEQAVEAERLDYDQRQIDAEDAATPENGPPQTGKPYTATVPEMQGRAVRQTEPIETADNVGRDLEAEAERAAIQDEGGDTSFDFDNDPTAHLRAPREYLNLARTGLDKTGEARVREIVERGRAAGTIDKGYRSFDEADVGALKEKSDLVKKLVEDPLLLDRQKLRNVSTDEIKAMWMVVGDNTKTLEAAARVMNDPEATPKARQDAADLYDAANKQTESLVSSIVTETAQKGRELGALRNIAKQSTDAEVWLVNAKRLAPDKPLPDGVMANIRRLAREAQEICRAS